MIKWQKHIPKWKLKWTPVLQCLLSNLFLFVSSSDFVSFMMSLIALALNQDKWGLLPFHIAPVLEFSRHLTQANAGNQRLNGVLSPLPWAKDLLKGIDLIDLVSSILPPLSNSSPPSCVVWFLVCVICRGCMQSSCTCFFMLGLHWMGFEREP